MGTAIALPFRFNEFGQLDTSSNESKFWKDQVLLTIMTRFGERVMRPDFGSDVSNSLFENLNVASEVAVNGINIAFNTWLPQLRLIEVSPEFNEETSEVEVTIIYAIPSGESDTITLNTAIINR